MTVLHNCMYYDMIVDGNVPNPARHGRVTSRATCNVHVQQQHINSTWRPSYRYAQRVDTVPQDADHGLRATNILYCRLKKNDNLQAWTCYPAPRVVRIDQASAIWNVRDVFTSVYVFMSALRARSAALTGSFLAPVSSSTSLWSSSLS